MIDMSFIRTLEATISVALASALAKQDTEAVATMSAAVLRRISKEAAQRLFFELDGKTLIDLGLSKLEAEQRSRLPKAEAPSDSEAESPQRAA
jgi:hypothetical protein